MITQTFPSLRPPPKYKTPVYEFGKKQTHNPPWVRPPNTADIELAKKLKISPEEVVRRDEIVRKLWLDCKFHVGEYLIAKTEPNRKVYGKLYIRGILKSYHEFNENEKWPDDDVPYIICATSEHKGEIICTSEFFMREGQHGGTC